MSSFFDLIKQRQSCRDYSGANVKKEDLLKCIEAARLAPSARNAQPWHFYVVTNEEIKKEVADATQEFNKKAGAFIVILEEENKLPKRLGKKDYAKLDIGIAASHICLAATELGLATCMLGIFKEDKVKKALNIPDSKKIRLLISVGYANNSELRKKERKEINEILNYVE